MKQYIICENDSGQRLDKFLKKLFLNASVSLIYKLNRTNKIKVNNKKQDNEYKLLIGDEVKIFLGDNDFDILTKKVEEKKIKSNEEFDKTNIVYEDTSILIINKDAGINVHPGDYKTKETNIIYQIQNYLGDKLNSLTFKPSLVHRIDRDTSGILIIGKKKDILTKLVNDFKEHKKIKKIYYVIVLGKMPFNSGTIDKKLLRIEGAKNEDKVQINETGQTAITNYKVLNEKILNTPKGPKIISQLEVEILTGRMHQIRVHLASLGTPIIGDDKYGDKIFNFYISKNYGLKRQALHAWKIEFFHYGKNKKISLEAKIKPDLLEFINSF